MFDAVVCGKKVSRIDAITNTAYLENLQVGTGSTFVQIIPKNKMGRVTSDLDAVELLYNI